MDDQNNSQNPGGVVQPTSQGVPPQPQSPSASQNQGVVKPASPAQQPPVAPQNPTVTTPAQQPPVAPQAQPTAVPSPTAMGSMNQPPVVPKKKSGKFKLIAIIVAVLIVAIGSFIGYSYWSYQKQQDAGYQKIEEILSFAKGQDPSSSGWQQEAAGYISDMGYNVYTTDREQAKEIFEIATVFGLLYGATQSGGSLIEQDKSFGKNQDGDLLTTKEYELRWSSLPQPFVIKVQSRKDGETWKAASIASTPTVTSVLQAAGVQLPVSQDAFEFDQDNN